MTIPFILGNFLDSLDTTHVYLQALILGNYVSLLIIILIQLAHIMQLRSRGVHLMELSYVCINMIYFIYAYMTVT